MSFHVAESKISPGAILSCALQLYNCRGVKEGGREGGRKRAKTNSKGILFFVFCSRAKLQVAIMLMGLCNEVRGSKALSSFDSVFFPPKINYTAR